MPSFVTVRLRPPLSAGPAPEPAAGGDDSSVAAAAVLCCCPVCLVRWPLNARSPLSGHDGGAAAAEGILDLHWDAYGADGLLQSAEWSTRNRVLLSQIKAAHAHCFPVEYDDHFFETFFTSVTNIVLLVFCVQDDDDAGGGGGGGSAIDDDANYRPFLPPAETGEMLRLARERGTTGRSAPTVGRQRGTASVLPLSTATMDDATDPRPARILGWPRDPRSADVCRQLVGFVTVRSRPYQCEPLLSSSASASQRRRPRREGYIATLGVRREARKHKLARSLVDRARSIAFTQPLPSSSEVGGGGSCFERLWLHCLDGNSTATKLYLSLGFTLCDFLPAYYNIHGTRYDANILCIAHPSYSRPQERSITDVPDAYDPRSFAQDPDDDRSGPTATLADDGDVNADDPAATIVRACVQAISVTLTVAFAAMALMVVVRA